MSVTHRQVDVTTRSPVSVAVRAVYQPPLFHDFHAAAENVLINNFSYAHRLKVKAKSSGGIYQEYTVSAASPLTGDTPLIGSLTANYTSDAFDVDSTYYTESSQHADIITLRPKGGALPAGTTLNINAASQAPAYGYKSYVGSVEATYSANYLSGGAQVFSDLNTHTLDANVVIGIPNGEDGVGVGATVRGKNSTAGTDIENAEVGLHYRSKDFSAAVVTQGFMSRVAGSWTQFLSPHTSIAAQLSSPLSTGNVQRVLTLGTSHQIDTDTIINIKTVVPDASVAVYLEKRVGTLNSGNSWLRSLLPKGTVGLALQSSGKKGTGGGLGVASIDKYGLSYTLGEY